MIRRKSKFLTFCFSMLPGAGHMYLGFMKQGISLMTMFFGICFLGSILNMGALIFLIPVLWFYSFFDALNKNSMSDQDFYKQEDHYLFNIDFSELQNIVQGRFRIVIATVFLLIGASLLFSNFTSFLREFLPWSFYEELYFFISRIPQLVIAVFIILVGLRLLKGKDSFYVKSDDDIVFNKDDFQKDAFNEENSPKDEFPTEDNTVISNTVMKEE